VDALNKYAEDARRRCEHWLERLRKELIRLT
jgi:hypothetical protein